jgi:glycine/D-amino acid oxidase-like deaminating enzyme/nitrite reductase/ring-hydroxylating ferredoxin subunit
MDASPIWFAQAPASETFPPLAADTICDVLIVGGGITGITAAHLLWRGGADVIVVERGRIAGRETGHTTAHLTNVTDVKLPNLLAAFGPSYTKAVWAAGDAALTQIEQNASFEGVECDFRRVPGYLVERIALGADATNILDREYILALHTCDDAVRLERETPVLGRRGVCFRDQAKFHPRRYVLGLARKLGMQGCPIFENTNVTEFDAKERVALANGHRVRCRYLVMATHAIEPAFASPLSTMLLQTKLAAYTTYAVSASLPRGSVEEALFWDTDDPYCYLRLDVDKETDTAILGGEDHKTGQDLNPEQAFKNLEERLRSLLPVAEIDHRWSGQVIESVDGMPYIGEIEEGEFVATGFAGNGMTFGTLAGMMAADIILSGDSPWSDLFDIRRKKFTAVARYLRENKDYPVRFVRDRAKGRDDRPGTPIPGQGAVISESGEKIAVFQPEEGDAIRLSAVCPHMGCIVAWNAADHTWDCPCHGSRFQATGEVIAGPAQQPLKPADVMAKV